MTARPISHEFRRNPARVAVALVLFTFLLTTGCTFFSGMTNQTVTVTPSQTNCPTLPANVTPYISVNYIGNFTLGDMVEINGTTNYPGFISVRITNTLGWWTGPSPVGNVSYTPIPSFSHEGNATMTNDNCNNRTWSYLMDSRDLVKCPSCSIWVWPNGDFIETSPIHIKLFSYRDPLGHQSWGEVRV